MPENFVQKYVIVSLIQPVVDGLVFDASEWPLHTTVAPRFTTVVGVDDLVKTLEKFAKEYAAFNVEIGDDAMFGDKNDLPVSLVVPTEVLENLHTALITTLTASGAIFDEPSYIGDGYRPHITVQKQARVRKRENIYLTSLSLIDMFPDGNPHNRKVLKTVSLNKY
ncbi:MAG: 2'-5' RNA ligase family protein [Patescibacteria group bacterium]|nr:2'-5' RNA ligase family protein [Patescibacteria group bacterium]